MAHARKISPAIFQDIHVIETHVSRRQTEHGNTPSYQREL